MVGFSRLTDLPAVVDKDIRETAPPFFRKQFLDIFFNPVGVLILRKPQSQGKPLDMCIHHHTRDIEDSAQNTIGRFSANTGQF